MSVPNLLPVILAASLAASGAAAQPAAPAKKPAAAPPPLLVGPELWRGARIGMEPAEISARFPAAAPSKGELLPDGARSELALDTTVGGALANAQFYFNANGLETIIVDRADVAPKKTEDNLAKAHRIVDELTAEYGEPTACTEQRQLAALTCTWIFGQSKAVLSYRDTGGWAPRLSLAYRKANDDKPWAPRPVRRLKSR